MKNWPIFLKKYVRTVRSQTHPFMFLTVMLSKFSPKPKKNNWGPDIKESEPISIIITPYENIIYHNGIYPSRIFIERAHGAAAAGGVADMPIIMSPEPPAASALTSKEPAT